MTRNLVIGEALQVFDQKDQERATETNKNYELAMKDMIYHFFIPKSLQQQKRYLQRGLYKPRDTKIREFKLRIDDTAEYLKKLPPFG